MNYYHHNLLHWLKLVELIAPKHLKQKHEDERGTNLGDYLWMIADFYNNYISLWWLYRLSL